MQLSFSLLFYVLLSVLSAFTITSLAIHIYAIPTDRTTTIMDNWNLKRFSNNIFDITSDFSGNIYFVERDGNRLAQLSPATNTITEWTIPTNSSGPTGAAIDPFSGNIYFAEHNANKIGRLSPATNTITEWTIPTNSSGPTGVAFDSSTGNLYFAENNANKIGRLMPSTNSFTEWTVGNNPLAIYTDSSGNLYFIGGGGTLGRLG
jgi:virginiamycin B lyase